jgi:predicted S18 family serine protease
MPKKRRSSDFVIIAIAFFLLGTVTGMLVIGNEPQGTPAALPQAQIAQLSSTNEVIMDVPAVDAEGSGVVGQLVTDVRPGTGQVLVDVKNLITLGDTQQSAQDAVKAAAAYTGMNLNNYDVILNMHVNATSIEGPSAGASMGVSAVFALLGKAPRSDVMMTGTIDDNGNIGPVGAIFEKARVAKESGAVIFVVPKGQSAESQTTRTRQCRQVGATTVCRIVYQSNPVNIGQALNMTVVEVSTLKDAVKYFTP